MTGPIPAAERYAALTALAAGLKHLADQAKAEALTEAQAHGVKAFDTPYGAVNIVRKDATPTVNDDALIEWATAQGMPMDDVVTYAVRPGFRAAMLGKVTIAGGHVIDKETGEVVPWATVTPAGDDPYVSYPASAAQREAKAWAVELFADRAGDLTTGLRELTGP